jgi:DNA-binding transcriptional ArsR family regulator
MDHEIKHNYTKHKNAIAKLQALRKPLKGKILNTIANNNFITVTKLGTLLGLPQAVISLHLSELRRNGFVKGVRCGESNRFIKYRVIRSEIERTLGIAKELADGYVGV